jgi:hypothetical protein
MRNSGKENRVAERRIFFESDRLRIEGLIEELPGEKGVVITHPHPLYGGTMHNNVVKAVAAAYQDKGYSTLRCNFRGVEKSEGVYDNGVGEQEDVKGALKCLSDLAKKVIDLAGYSFGAWVIALGLEKYESVKRVVMVSPPVDVIDFSFLQHNPKIQLVITGSRDDIGGYRNIQKMLPKWNEKAVFKVIDGADHFYGGKEDELKEIIKEFLKLSA